MRDSVPLWKLRLMRDNLKSVVFTYTGWHVGTTDDLKIALDELISFREEKKNVPVD